MVTLDTHQRFLGHLFATGTYLMLRHPYHNYRGEEIIDNRSKSCIFIETEENNGLTHIYNFRRSRICFTLAMSIPITTRHSIPDAAMAVGAEKMSAHTPNAEEASGIRAWSSW